MCPALPHQQIRSCNKARRLLKIPDFGKTWPRIIWRLLARPLLFFAACSAFLYLR